MKTPDQSSKITGKVCLLSREGLNPIPTPYIFFEPVMNLSKLQFNVVVVKELPINFVHLISFLMKRIKF